MKPEIKKIIETLSTCEGLRPDQACEKIHNSGICTQFKIACDECPLENVSVMIGLIKR